MDKYKASLAITTAYYPKNYIGPITKFRTTLKGREAFEVRMLKIGKRHNFALKLELSGGVSELNPHRPILSHRETCRF